MGGVLLTGGSSRRLGVDKARLELDGESLARRAARVLESVCEQSIEVGSGVSGLRCVREQPPGSGPLAALVAGADALSTTSLIVLAVDLPRVGEAVLRLLADRPGAGAVVPRVHGQPQWVCARYGADALAAARSLVSRGERSLRALADVVEVEYLDEEWRAVAPDDAFADVDTPDDVQRLGLDRPG